MKNRLMFLLLFILGSPTLQAAERTMEFGRFGKVTLYQKADHPSQVVLFVSGDGGWNMGVIDMADALSSLNAVVVGIDITRYLKELKRSHDKCSYPAADFEELSQYVQKALQLPDYIPPVLVGYSSGATLVYAILAQAPPNTFSGAISMGFCPDLPLNKPFCKGRGLSSLHLPGGQGYTFPPVQHLEAPWIAFQGTIDQVCSAKDVEAFVKQVPQGDLVLLPKVGHGFSVQKNWMPQFREAFKRLVSAEETTPPSTIPSTQGLPLIEVKAKGAMRDAFAVIVSGDGGWAGIDRELAKALSEDGIPVVGLNSLKYFWKKKTPEESAQDLERILRTYQAVWKMDNFILIGYSRGADVLPFMVRRLPEDLKKKTDLVALLGLEKDIEFEIHPGDFLNLKSPHSYRVEPEMEGLKDLKVMCFWGAEETDSLCPLLDKSHVDIRLMKGGHHFGGNYKGIAKEILDSAHIRQ